MNINETALVLIDMQKEDNFNLVNLETVIKNSKKLVSEVRNKKIPIIYTRQINRSDGVGLSKGEPLNDDGSPFYYSSDTDKIEIIDEIKPLDSDIIIDKHRWSAFYETNLDLLLKSLGVKHLIIGGLVTDGCLMTTVFDAYFRDYNIHLIKDICTTTSEGTHMASLMIMANWIYTMEIYDTTNLIRRINREPYQVWEAKEPDSLQFTPELMREVFTKIC